MAFFKRVQKKVNDLWYPQSVTWGKAVTTREVADELSFISTVTRGDTYAVMENLGRVLSNFMGQGRTVKIDGIGTFYYTATSTKRGEDFYLHRYYSRRQYRWNPRRQRRRPG